MESSASVSQMSMAAISCSSDSQQIYRYDFREVIRAIEDETITAITAHAKQAAVTRLDGAKNVAVQKSTVGHNKIIMGLVVLLLMTIAFFVGFSAAGHAFKGETILSGTVLCAVKVGMIIYLYFFGKEKEITS